MSFLQEMDGAFEPDAFLELMKLDGKLGFDGTFDVVALDAEFFGDFKKGTSRPAIQHGFHLFEDLIVIVSHSTFPLLGAKKALYRYKNAKQRRSPTKNENIFLAEFECEGTDQRGSPIRT